MGGGGEGRREEPRRVAWQSCHGGGFTQHHHSYMQCSVQKASDDSDGGDDTTPGFFALVGETRRRGKWCHRVDSQRRAQPWIGAVEVNGYRPQLVLNVDIHKPWGIGNRRRPLFIVLVVTTAAPISEVRSHGWRRRGVIP